MKYRQVDVVYHYNNNDITKLSIESPIQIFHFSNLLFSDIFLMVAIMTEIVLLNIMSEWFVLIMQGYTNIQQEFR